jgi:GWxTD domain-containing protein
MSKTMKILAAPAVVVLMAAVAPRWQGGEEPLQVSAIRFYDPASATTTIEGVCEVRLPALMRGAAQGSRYRVEVAILDSAGLELKRSDWTRDVPASMAHAHSATAVESFEFGAAPGRYRIRVRLVPPSGDAVERTLDVAAYGAAPQVSDLLLSSGVRRPVTDSEAPAPGEIRRAGLIMRTAPVPRLTPTEASLSWYAELYRNAGAGAGTGDLVAEVLGPGGHRIVGTAPRPVTVPAGGGLTRGSLDLAGLPEGAYVLRLHVRLGDSSVTTESPFSMGSLASVAAADAAGGQEASVSAADMFEEANEARLDSLKEPLVYVARSSRNLRVYQTLTVEGKRRFLREFWAASGQRIDGSVGRDEFYRDVAFATEAYRESGAAQIPGWNTDRGRIYLRNGRPDETRGWPANSNGPFVVWKYTRDRPRWYVFFDQTGLGHFALLATSDRHENGYRQTGWESVLGPDGTREAYAFLGMDLRNFGINQ